MQCNLCNRLHYYYTTDCAICQCQKAKKMLGTVSITKIKTHLEGLSSRCARMVLCVLQNGLNGGKQVVKALVGGKLGVVGLDGLGRAE